jgi:hypothetical protein
MAQASDEDFGVYALLEAQRRFANSKRLSDRFFGPMCIAGLLRKCLAKLTDRQVGQLVSDVVADELRVLSPEMEICEHAARRLFRSAGGSWAEDDKSAMDEDTPPCPACGSETTYHIGIDEPDFLLCVRADCEHKEPLGICTNGASGDEDD